MKDANSLAFLFGFHLPRVSKLSTFERIFLQCNYLPILHDKAKAVLVMEHIACGAVSGTIDNAEMDNRKGSDHDFVDAVANTNAEMIIEDIRENS